MIVLSTKHGETPLKQKVKNSIIEKFTKAKNNKVNAKRSYINIMWAGCNITPCEFCPFDKKPYCTLRIALNKRIDQLTLPPTWEDLITVVKSHK